MAPISRTTRSGAGIGKKVQRKHLVHKEPSNSWSLLHSQGMNPKAVDIVMGHDDDDDDRTPSPPLNGPADVEQAVEPLREVAERVGTQVEDFAVELDKFFQDLPTASNRFDAVHELVDQFKSIADKTIDDLKKRYDRDLREYQKQEWNEQGRVSTGSSTTQGAVSVISKSTSPRILEQLKELQKWQQESDLWDLFRTMLELHPFESEAEAMRTENEDKLARLGPPHRYSSEGDLWERFIIEDDLARERYYIKKWLERTVDHQQSDLQGIVEILESKAGRGKGLWSSGWLDTREKIKGEKRLRSWPSAVDSPLPQIRRSDNNELLVTTLDPDAPGRQQRTLEKADTYFERAMWIACWEMLRRGMPWQDICDWCEQRKEGWRAVSMGAAIENTESAGSSAAWKRMCLQASQSNTLSEYGAAVFGLLGGNVKAVEKVCRTVDDHLYAFYSAALVRQFDQYLLAVCPDKATPPQWRRNVADDTIFDPEQAAEAINELISRLRQGPKTKNESAQPIKIIQSYLLADEVGSLIHTVGAATAETAALHGPENMIFLRCREARQDGLPLPEAEVALDPQTLRITAHMAIVHNVLRPTELEGDELLEDENVLVAYIQALRKAGKRDPIPTYASRLHRERCILVLGRVLQDIRDSQEMSNMLGLLQEYDLEVIPILVEQLKWVMEHSLGGEALKQPLRILERTEETKLHPGQRVIVGFLPGDISEADEAIVRCLSWFQLMRGGWKVMFEALTVATRRCLLTGRFSCARLIVQNFPYNEVSLRKSYETIGRSVNLMDNSASTPYDEQEALSWELMKRQSRTYYELEQLVKAVERLSAWRTEEHKYVSKAQKPSTVPSALKRAKADVSAAMEPILKGILQNPTDEEEAADLKDIRNSSIPEVVIAYNTVLHAAGNLITRDCLLESMELVNTIARNDKSVADPEQSNGLEECFVQAGRMRELVESFALTSKAMLILKAEGKQWKPKKDREGKDLGVWEIGNVPGRVALGGEE